MLLYTWSHLNALYREGATKGAYDVQTPFWVNCLAVVSLSPETEDMKHGPTRFGISGNSADSITGQSMSTRKQLQLPESEQLTEVISSACTKNNLQWWFQSSWQHQATAKLWALICLRFVSMIMPDDALFSVVCCFLVHSSFRTSEALNQRQHWQVSENFLLAQVKKC